jgi:hypothetical protein
MVSWFWIPLAAFGGFILGGNILALLSSGREEDAYSDGYVIGRHVGFEAWIKSIGGAGPGGQAEPISTNPPDNNWSSVERLVAP